MDLTPLQSIRDAYARSGRLFEVHCDLLYQCDLDCEHCYLDDKARRILPASFWLDVVDQLADMQAFMVEFSGGEVLIRKDLWDIVARARSHGLYVGLRTHGGRLDDEAARRIADLGVTVVQVSYYATTPEVHDAVTRRPGSHARTLAAIRRLRAHGVHVRVAVSALRRNRDEVAAIHREMADLGVPVHVTSRMRLAESGDAFPREVGLSTRDQARVRLAENEVLAGAYAGEAEVCSLEPASNDWGDAKLCVAGHTFLYVDPEGRVFPCLTFPVPLGDLTKGDRLEAIWRGSPALDGVRALRRRDRPVCRECGLRAECDYCPGEGLLEHGDPKLPAAAVCENTWANAVAKRARLGLPPPPEPASWRLRPQGPRFRVLSAQEATRARAEAAAGPS